MAEIRFSDCLVVNYHRRLHRSELNILLPDVKKAGSSCLKLQNIKQKSDKEFSCQVVTVPVSYSRTLVCLARLLASLSPAFEMVKRFRLNALH